MSGPRNPWFGRIAILTGLVATFAIGYGIRGGGDHPDTGMETVEAEATRWTCSMHPQIQLPDPGPCPICGMDLIPLRTSDEGSTAPRTLTMSPSAAAIASIRTSPVERRAVEREIRTVGKLEPDETRVREIAAWVPGRIDRLHVNSTGVTVRAGQRLFDLYSPDLYSAQEELLQAIKSADQLGRSSLESSRRSATRTVEAARERLRLWGLTTDQVAAIVDRGSASEHLTIVAPMSGTVVHKNAVEGRYVKAGAAIYSIADLNVLWLQLDVFESDLASVAVGQSVRFDTDAFRGEEFSGRVSFVDPLLDPRSRSVKVRVEVPNSDGRLRPGMFARATIQSEVNSEEGVPLVIPASAPLVTGKRAVVYVAHPDRPGEFQGREVRLGARAGDFVVVESGLTEGESVVTNGAFKIDSALQILARGSMMNPEGGGPVPGHDHTGTPPAADNLSATDSNPAPIAGIPPGFRAQLDPTLSLYFDVTEALSGDDLQTAQAAAAAIPAAVLEPAHSLLPAEGHQPWGELQVTLTSVSTAIANAEDLSSARDAFFELSQAATRLVRLFGASGATDVLLHHCPMAADGEGADWLQRREGIANPYYGASMLKCGSLVDTLAVATGSEPSHENH